MTLSFGCKEKTPCTQIAQINGQPLDVKEFREQAAFMGMGSDPAMMTKELRLAVLEAMVRKTLVVQQAKAKGIELTPEELTREENLLRRGQEENDFQNALAAQGLSYSLWRRILARELLVKKTLDLVLAGKAKISPQQVRAYYQAHLASFEHPRQILAQHAVLPNKKVADQLAAKVRRGEDLGQAAAALGVALDGAGKAVWLSRGHMPPELDKKAFALKEGKVGGPWKSEYGYHVIKVLKVRGKGAPSLAEAADGIQQKLQRQRKQALAEEWIERLRAKAKVKFEPAFLEEGRTGLPGSDK